MTKSIYPWENWSARKLKLLLVCPQSFFFSYIIGLKATPGINGIFGLAIHEMAKKFFTPQNGYLSEDSFIGTWQHYWWTWIVKNRYKGLLKGYNREELKKFFAIGVDMLKAFYKENYPFLRQELRPLMEKDLACALGEHLLSGRLDRIQPFPDIGHEIWDYKTSRYKMAESELARDIQFSFYNRLYLAKYRKNPKQMFIYYLSDGEKVQVPIRTNEDYERLSYLLDEVVLYVKNILLPSPDLPKVLPLSGLNPEDIERRQFSNRPGRFCNICDNEIYCRGFQPNDSMPEDLIRQEVARVGRSIGYEQLKLSVLKSSSTSLPV